MNRIDEFSGLSGCLNSEEERAQTISQGIEILRKRFKGRETQTEAEESFFRQANAFGRPDQKIEDVERDVTKIQEECEDWRYWRRHFESAAKKSAAETGASLDSKNFQEWGQSLPGRVKALQQCAIEILIAGNRMGEYASNRMKVQKVFDDTMPMLSPRRESQQVVDEARVRDASEKGENNPDTKKPSRIYQTEGLKILGFLVGTGVVWGVREYLGTGLVFRTFNTVRLGAAAWWGVPRIWGLAKRIGKWVVS